MVKGKAKAKAKSLHIKSKSEVKQLDQILKNGRATIFVVVVSWCGACQRVKPMWMNALKKKNQKNLVVVENEHLPSTSLRSLNITHFPSTFEIPPGGTPTLLSNPQDIKGVNETLNSPEDPNSYSEESESEEQTESASSTPISASDFVNSQTMRTQNQTMRTPSPTVLHTNSKSNTVIASIKPASLTPMEKLRGGRRTRQMQRQRQRQTRRRRTRR
jgi:thiol-disulfide isomerase/thioredoxin